MELPELLLVITDADVRSRIAALVGETERVEQGFEPWISHAPVHVVVLVRATGGRTSCRTGTRPSGRCFESQPTVSSPEK